MQCCQGASLHTAHAQRPVPSSPSGETDLPHVPRDNAGSRWQGLSGPRHVSQTMSLLSHSVGEADPMSGWRKRQNPKAREPKCHSERTMWSYFTIYHTSFFEFSRFRANTRPCPCRSPCRRHTEVPEGLHPRTTLVPGSSAGRAHRTAPNSRYQCPCPPSIAQGVSESGRLFVDHCQSCMWSHASFEMQYIAVF